MPNFSNMTYAELAAWVQNFTIVVGANPSDYAMTAAQVTEFRAKNDDFVEKITARTAADDAAKAAVVAQRTSRQEDEAAASYYNMILKANSNISDALKVEAGIDVKKPATHTAPAIPTGLIVNGFQDGTNILKWERNGNKPGTQYLIEYRPENETDFKFLGTTTETTYTQTGATPGAQCLYRVKAQRAGEQSTFSNVAVVYMN
jgi:hypothetical protein